jgi:hypothetical protein
MREYHRDRFSGSRAVYLIIAILVAWAITLSVGICIAPGGQWHRALVVVGAMATFTAVWIVAFRWRAR